MLPATNRPERELRATIPRQSCGGFTESAAVAPVDGVTDTLFGQQQNWHQAVCQIWLPRGFTCFGGRSIGHLALLGFQVGAPR